jgi:Ricin-type beta-trefoil lectin domain
LKECGVAVKWARLTGQNCMRIAGIVVGALAAIGLAFPAVAQQTGMTLQPDRLPGMCISMTGGSGQADSQPCDGSDAQRFDLPGSGVGPIRHGDKCLVPRGEGYYPGLLPAACDGSPEQAWTFTEEGELRSKAGRCISLLGASSRTGEMVFAGECPKEGQAHVWRARRVDFTNVVEMSLESKAKPGMCIGYDTGVGLYDCTDQFRQVISFDRKAIGQMRMMSSCFSGGYAFGALSLGSCWDDPSQKWLVMDTGQIVSANVQCIEVVNENGRDVLRTKGCKLIPEQQWILRAPKRP